MDVIISKGQMQNQLENLAGQIEGLYNLLYDHKRNTIASCYDAMLETMAKTVTRIKREVATAPKAGQ